MHYPNTSFIFIVYWSVQVTAAVHVKSALKYPVKMGKMKGWTSKMKYIMHVIMMRNNSRSFANLLAALWGGGGSSSSSDSGSGERTWIFHKHFVRSGKSYGLAYISEYDAVATVAVVIVAVVVVVTLAVVIRVALSKRINSSQQPIQPMLQCNISLKIYIEYRVAEYCFALHAQRKHLPYHTQ